MTATVRSASGWLLAGVLVNLVIFPLNHIAGAVANGGDYTPFSVSPSVGAMVYDETAYYAIGPSRYLQSGRLTGDLDVFELRDVPNASYPMLHSIVIGSLARVTGGLARAWMIVHAVLPTLTWALLFWYAYRTSGLALVAMAVAWATCFAAFGPRNFLLLTPNSFTQPLELTRLASPGLAFPILLAATWLLGAMLAKPSVARLIVAGVAAGVVLYAYYFYWVAFFVGVFVLFLFFLLAGRVALAWRLCAVVGIAAVVGIPHVLRTVRGLGDPHQALLMSRFGGFGRTPDVLGLVLAAVALAALWVIARAALRNGLGSGRAIMLGILAVTSGAAIGLNLQLITGFNAQHEHFYNRLLQPLGLYAALLAIIAAPWRFLTARRLTRIAAVGIVLMLGLASVRQVQVGQRSAPAHRASDPDIDVLAWLRPRTTADTVIAARDGYLISLIPAITGGWSFVPMGYRSLNAADDTVTRWLALSRLEIGNWDGLEAELGSDPGFTWNSLPVSHTFIVERSEKPGAVALMKLRWPQIDPGRELALRRLDYFIGRRDRALPMLDGAALGAVEYENSAWRVIRVRTHTSSH